MSRPKAELLPVRRTYRDDTIDAVLDANYEIRYWSERHRAENRPHYVLIGWRFTPKGQEPGKFYRVNANNRQESIGGWKVNPRTSPLEDVSVKHREQEKP